MIDLYSSIISFIAVTLASTYLVALAYRNTKFVLKHKVSIDMEANETSVAVCTVESDKNLLLRLKVAIIACSAEQFFLQGYVE
jgi:translocon-associated protein subunit gamma